MEVATSVIHQSDLAEVPEVVLRVPELVRLEDQVRVHMDALDSLDEVKI